MSREDLNMSIGALAKAAGVNVETIRFYQRKGLLQKPKRDRGVIRRYALQDVERVRFIKAAQRIGFSLEEAGELLDLDGGGHCEEARTMAEQKLNDVRARLMELQRVESALARLVADCGAAKGTVKCPLIASLQASGGAADHIRATRGNQ
jgi:MerR family mercuric resistance operon transcriptional regulator